MCLTHMLCMVHNLFSGRSPPIAKHSRRGRVRVSRVESGRGQASVFRKSHAGWGPHPEGADNSESQTETFKEGYSSRVRKSLGEWSDDLCVIVLYPDPRAERLQRRLEQ